MRFFLDQWHSEGKQIQINLRLLLVPKWKLLDKTGFLFLLDKEWCSNEWEQFRELEIKCNEGEITPVYSEHPLFGFPSCSLISSYQFIARTQQHALLLSGNNPALLSSFREGLDIEVGCSMFFKPRKDKTESELPISNLTPDHTALRCSIMSTTELRSTPCWATLWQGSCMELKSALLKASNAWS